MILIQVTRLRRQIESDSRDQATYLVYDKRVKEMAAELTGKTSITYLVHQMWNSRLSALETLATRLFFYPSCTRIINYCLNMFSNLE